MKCVNCGYDINKGYRCSNCGIDSFILLKTRNTSIQLYNKALSLANEYNLSEAIVLLEESLLFDKNNIQARNLLGLVYFEMGQVADAIKHWIFTTSALKENNPANRYMDYLQKNPRVMEEANDAVMMYNKAIECLQHGSDDLAIIQLKRALDTNPHMIAGNNLMTLCCLDEKNYQRAQEFVDFVLKKDTKNPLALHYQARIYKETGTRPMKRVEAVSTTVSHGGELSKTVSSKKTDSAPPIPRYQRQEKNKLLDKKSVFSFVLGIASASIVIFVLIVPALNETKDTKLAELEAQMTAFSESITMSPEDVEAMRLTLEQLEAENKLLRSEETKQANLELLELAVSQLADEDYINCVTTLSSIETLGFTDADLTKFTSLKATSYPQAADALYTKGKGEFLSNEFTTAKTSLESALAYASDEIFIDDAYYYLGKIAENDQDYETAKMYYNKVLAEYPDTNQKANIENALEQIAPVE
ncbi:MAG: tetratricopeptide repeat protein [Bacillota bacterium]